MAAATAFETLELLNDIDLGVGETVVKVEERVTQKESAVVRSVQMAISVPNVSPPRVVGARLPFGVVLHSPEKGEIWAVDDVYVEGANGGRILGHEEHEVYSRGLIAIRFWSVCGDWALDDVDGNLPIANSVVSRLMAIVEANPEEAHRILREVFSEDGCLKILGEALRSAVHEQRLWRLCHHLADRYLVVALVDTNQESFITIGYSYESAIPDVDSTFRTRSTRVNRLRALLGAGPTTMLFKVPLLRVTPSYDLRVELDRSTYVHTQSFLERYSDPAGGIGYRNLSEGAAPERVWRNGVGTSTAHLFASGGHRRKTGTFVGIKAFERLPGSAGRASFFAVGALVVCVLLTGARLVADDRFAGDAAAIGVALLSLLAFSVESVFLQSGTSSLALSSRASELATALTLLVYSLWLLVPMDAGKHRAGPADWIRLLLVRGVWACVMVALVLNAALITRRWSHARREFYRASRLDYSPSV